MKRTVNLSFIYFFINFELIILVGSSETFIFEAIQNGLRKSNSLFPNYRRFYNAKEHPEPLPPSTLPPANLQQPYRNLYQGSRRPNDTRVYRRRFEYGPKQSGHHVFVEGSFDCIITHLAIETDGGIPILLRGGVGHHFFVVVCRAKSLTPLRGSVRAYCLKNDDEYYKDHTTRPPARFYR